MGCDMSRYHLVIELDAYPPAERDEAVVSILRNLADHIEGDDLDSEKVIRNADHIEIGRAWVAPDFDEDRRAPG